MGMAVQSAKAQSGVRDDALPGFAVAADVLDLLGVEERKTGV